MSYQHEDVPAQVSVSCFAGESGVDEYHLIVCPNRYGSVEAQLEWVNRAYRGALKSLGIDGETVVFRRFFCSDLANQAQALQANPLSDPGGGAKVCATSWVCQPPTPPGRVAMWAYHVHDRAGRLEKVREDSCVTVRRGELRHHWTTGMTCPGGASSHDQTRGILEDYVHLLAGKKLSLVKNLVRTWFFVQDVDTNYQGLVTARREVFAEHGLTSDTHFVASTGVEGTYADVAAKVIMDAYSIGSVREEQIEYLKAPDHLSPTYVYGVTFERGTAVSYQDRKHVMISGTASIDGKGEILHCGDVAKQLDRTMENMETLLEHAGARLEDVCVYLVYVRDPADFEAVEEEMRRRVGEAPMQVVLAKVCRPGWLVEVEALAVVGASRPELPAF